MNFWKKKQKITETKDVFLKICGESSGKLLQTVDCPFKVTLLIFSLGFVMNVFSTTLDVCYLYLYTKLQAANYF